MNDDDDIAAELAAPGLLTEAEAAAWARCRTLGRRVPTVATELNISESALYSRLQRAENKLEQAEATLAARDRAAAEHPTRCSECGGSLGTQWVGHRDDDPLCLDCADISDVTR